MRFRHIGSILLLSLAFMPVLAQEMVEVVTLKYHRAKQVIPLLLPLVAPHGAVTGMQNHLVIRADAAQHAQIRQVLAQVDIAPRRLQITLRQNTTRQALARDHGVYGRVGAGDARIVVPDLADSSAARVEARSGRSRIGVRLGESGTSASGTDTQTLQVLEGNPAFIRLGQSIPFRGRRVYVDPRGATVVEDTQFVDVVSGFQVLPRMSGESVTLEIMPQRNSLGARGAIDVQQAATTVTTRLGEWVELGGIDRSQSADGVGIFHSQQTSESDRRGIFLRVDELK